jgi:CHASE1-domain containing sensor protein
MSKKSSQLPVAASGAHAGRPAVIIAIVGGILSVGLFLLAHFAEQRSIRRDFDSLADHRFRATDAMFLESAKLINFMDNVFLIAPPASSPEFAGYVRSLKRFFESDVSRSLEMHGLTWVPRVPRSQRDDFQRAARTAFDPKFQIIQSDDSGKEAASRAGSDCFPCYLSLGNTLLTAEAGHDLSLDPEMWKAMQQARDSGQAVATAPIKMPSDSGDRLGYRVFQPLFVGDSQTVADRRKACTGFLCLDLDLGVLIDNALTDVQPVGIDLSVYDETGGNSLAVCRHSSREQPSSTETGRGDDAHQWETTAPAEFFGRELQLCCRSTDVFWADRIIWQPWALLFGGLALTIVLTIQKLESGLRANAIEQVVATRLAAIQNEKAMLQSA